MNAEAAKIVEQLDLAPLPHEGGYFRRIWTSASTLAPERRPAASAIHFLLTRRNFSALHRLHMEELWFFHSGDPIDHVRLAHGSAPKVTTLGPEITPGASGYCHVAAGNWQGARLHSTGVRGWTLLHCVVAPSWDEREFELGDRDALTREFPAAVEWIQALTR